MILGSGLQAVLESQNMIDFYDSSQSVYASGSSPSTLYYVHSHCVFCRQGSCYVFYQ